MHRQTHLFFSLGDNNINFGLIVRILGQPIMAKHDGIHPVDIEDHERLKDGTWPRNVLSDKLSSEKGYLELLLRSLGTVTKGSSGVVDIIT